MKHKPPPLGLSAETTFRIDKDGRFLADGVLVTHPLLLAKLFDWLEFDETENRYVLRNELGWGFVSVDDTPLIVCAAKFTHEGAWLQISNGHEEFLLPERLWLDEHDVPYCLATAKQFPARWNRTAAFELLSRVVVDGDKRTIQLGKLQFLLGSVPLNNAQRLLLDQ